MKDGLTMSLDGYIVGEITSDESWHFINAGVTDHVVAGTIHSNSASDAPIRLLSMIETFNPGPKQETILSLISRSIDYIIYLNDFKVVEIGRVKGYNSESKAVDIELIRVGDLNA